MRLLALIFRFFVWIWLALSLLSPIAHAEKNEKNKEAELAPRVEALEVEMDLIREQQKLLVQKSTVGFHNASFYNFGLTLASPRSRTFSTTVDNALGVTAGLGFHLGPHHVFQGSLDWDLYPSLTFRYWYELHSLAGTIAWGPVLGVKARLLDIGPIDAFIADSKQLKPFFPFYGLLVGIPLTHAMITLDVSILANQQIIVMTTAGIQFFFF